MRTNRSEETIISDERFRLPGYRAPFLLIGT